MKKSNKKEQQNKKTIQPIERTLKTSDKYLPAQSNKNENPKDKRWVAIIDKNKKEEYAVVRLTTKIQPNTTHLPTYKKGNTKETYFKHFVEIEDNEGKPITADGKKFRPNEKRYDLSKIELKEVQNKVYHHVKQAKSNNAKIKKLQNK